MTQRDNRYARGRVDFSIGNHANGGTVFHKAHADTTGLFAIGGNHTSQLWVGYNGGGHHTKEDKLFLLKEAAKSLGYNLVKQRAKT